MGMLQGVRQVDCRLYARVHSRQSRLQQCFELKRLSTVVVLAGLAGFECMPEGLHLQSSIEREAYVAQLMEIDWL